MGVRVEVFQYLKPLFTFMVCYLLTLIVKPESLYLKISFVVLFILLNAMLSVIKNDDLNFIRYGIRQMNS